MFLGTGLSCQYENPKWEEGCQQAIISDKLKGIIGNDIYIGNEVLELEEFMPLVKSLDDITEEDEREAEELDLKYADYPPIILYQKRINFLASKHYDICDWLGRGLANEIR